MADWKKYYLKNRESILEKQRARSKTPEARAKKLARYYKNHEAHLGYRRKWYAENREYCKAWWYKHGRSLKGLFDRGKHGASTRMLSWTISPEEFRDLRRCCCHYCGGTLPDAGVGLDRIDHSKGYEIDNVLPCCYDCNKHRQETWTVEEAETAISAVMLKRASCQQII